jgi:hypothetical protein
MSEDIEVDDIAILPIGTETNGTQPSAPKRKQIRTANYSQEEDLQLCRSWEKISLHPITGNEQPSKAYWKRIHDDFHANKTFASNRNENSLEHRWGGNSQEVSEISRLI